MGTTGSKEDIKNVSTDYKNADLLDMIAAKYILTQNFKDMEKLSQKPYCDKLIILTSDIIKKFMNEKTVKYLAEKKGANGIPKNFMNTEKVMYLDTAEIDNSAAQQRFSEKELVKIKKSQDEELSKELLEHYQKSKMKGGDTPGSGYKNLLQYLGSGSRFGNSSHHRHKPMKPRKRGVFAELDIRNQTKKQRMCKGIAKFYISIAHLYAAIVKTVNPTYVWKDSAGKRHERDIMNRYNIPKGVNPKLMVRNLCSIRYDILDPREKDGQVNINLTRVCSMNQKTNTSTRDSDPYRPQRWGKVSTNVKNLAEEPGIPQLRTLYNDYYDYTKGVFTKMIPGGKGEQQFKEDLKEFYEGFTASDTPYSEWNSAGDKSFKDIKLEDFQNKDVCTNDKSNYRRTYSGNRGLFTQYANHVKKMMTNAETNRTTVLSILDELFKIQTIQTMDAKKEIVTINPKLNEEKLAGITAHARKLIVKLYLDCEKDFKTALIMFNGIAKMRALQTTNNREEALSEQVNIKISNSSIESDVKNEVLESLKKPSMPKPIAPIQDKSDPLAALSRLTEAEKNTLILELLAKERE